MPTHTRSSQSSFENSSNHILSDWNSSAEAATPPGATTPPTGLASTWSDFMTPTNSHSNMLEPDLPQASLSSDILSMDPAFLESIAFSLEQFPPEPKSSIIGVSMDGFASNYSGTNILHAPSAVPMSFSNSQRKFDFSHEPMSSLETGTFYSSLSPNTDHSLGVRGPQQYTPSPDYAPAFGLPDPQYSRPVSQTHIQASARSVSPSSQESDDDRLQEKRRRNKLAARRLRQKKMDHMSDLESRLEEMTKERDELRLKAAKWEGEVMVLRQLLGKETAK